jgi:predicted nucleic acid-binding protein
LSRRYVLDANALVGLFEDREGVAGKVEKLLQEAARQDSAILMSAVNWGEVFYIVWKRHGEARAKEAEMNLQQMPIAVLEADQFRASAAATIKQKHDLSYADAFAAELAMELGAWLVTADPEFAKLGKMLSVYKLPSHQK